MAKLRRPAQLSFDCLTFEQGDQTLIMFACAAKTLWSVTQVNQRKEDGEKGYQRAVSQARVNNIADFIDKGNYIPTSLLISFKHAKLSANHSKLIVDNRQDAGWVIDGQHRLTGGNEAETDILLPVVAFIGITVQEQINCFVTINREQKGVSSSLYLELLKQLPGKRNPNEDAKQRAVDLAHQLRSDEASPFFGKIVSTTAPGNGEISLTNFVRKVQPMLKAPNGRLVHFTDDQRCKILNNYYKALRQIFPAEYKHQASIFFKTIGFGAMMGVLPTFIDITISESGGFKAVHAARTFSHIADIDFTEWRGLSGSGAESAITQDLLAELIKRNAGGDGRSTIDLD